MTVSPKLHPYGLWDSAITPLNMAGSLRLSGPVWADDGTLLWLESRADRSVIVLQPASGEALRDLNDQHSVRARVGYGGGDFTVGKGEVFFIAASSGRIYRQPIAGGAAAPITPEFGRAASPLLSPDGQWLLFVHSYEGQDCLAVVDRLGRYWPQRLASGDDFYMQPAWHPHGDRIAWISWNHPCMPWDGTRLWMASLSHAHSGPPQLMDASSVIGDQETSIFQPEFTPDGRFLAYVSDQTGWWQIYLYDLHSGEHRQLTSGEAEHAVPAWGQGLRTYCIRPDGSRLFFIRNQASCATLWQTHLPSGQVEPLPLGGEYTWLEQVAVSPDGDKLALIASGGRTPTRLIACTLPTGRSERAALRVVRRTTAEDLPTETYSPPQVITWEGMDGGEVHGVFYPPHNPAFASTGLPPLITMIHGGPSSQRTTSFDLPVQFFSSRGYAVLQVNHRGSTGFGRAYRDMLRGNWGIYDVQDAVSGVRWLALRNMVDAQRAVIMGGSAGGFTVLQSLIDYPDAFKAGINLYGVSDQFGLVLRTHKFEARYSDSLLGPLPEAAEVYRQRSPLLNADQIKAPLAVFHGQDDEAVPLSNSEMLVAALRRRGVPHIYHVYPGEGHGFRKPETIAHLYTEIEAFLKQYVIYA